MKQLLTLLIAIIFFSCRNEEKKESAYPENGNTSVSEGASANLSPSAKLGQEIFDGKGNCLTCHKSGEKAIGPSIEQIAEAYKSKPGEMVKFLKEEAKPIVDPSQYEVMKTNLYLTKTFSDDELKGLEDYFFSFNK